MKEDFLEETELQVDNVGLVRFGQARKVNHSKDREELTPSSRD